MNTCKDFYVYEGEFIKTNVCGLSNITLGLDSHGASNRLAQTGPGMSLRLRIQPAGSKAHPISNLRTEPMSDREQKRIVGVGRMNEHAVMVEYSDDTSAIYTVDQLAALTPIEIAIGEEVKEDGE